MDGQDVMTEQIQARGPVELWGLPDDARVVFELRQVRMPADWSPWQRLAWLDAQSSLWTELGHALDVASVSRGANKMADDLGGVAWWLLGQLRDDGASVPEDYPANVHALVSRVADLDVPGADER